MKTKNKINFKMYIILLYITSRKPTRQCSSQKFDYLFSLQGYIQEVVKSHRRKKSLSCSEINQVCSRPYHSQGKTQTCVTPVYLELRSDLGDLEHPYLICTSLFNWPKPILRLANDHH